MGLVAPLAPALLSCWLGLDLDALKSVLPGMVAMQPWAATAIALPAEPCWSATRFGARAVAVSTAWPAR